MKFTHRYFLHTAGFCTQQSFTQRKLLHTSKIYTEAFTYTSFYTKNLYAQKALVINTHSNLLHTASSCAEKL